MPGQNEIKPSAFLWCKRARPSSFLLRREKKPLHIFCLENVSYVCKVTHALLDTELHSFAPSKQAVPKNHCKAIPYTHINYGSISNFESNANLYALSSKKLNPISATKSSTLDCKFLNTDGSFVSQVCALFLTYVSTSYLSRT